ncbi:MAG: Delta-60 repeat-containing protein [Phycisphaerales bacterium]|nr:Delta-60 repeat-containing protein [Phycisphaerales bacterium]
MSVNEGRPVRIEVLESRTYLFGGQQDVYFGQLGTARETIEAPIDVSARGVAVDRDGRVVVGGVTSNQSPFNTYLTRYLPSGALDLSFGKSGVVLLNTSNVGDAYVRQILIQPDGRIVAVCNTVYSDFIAFALRDDGSIDRRFGTGGFLRAAGNANCAAMFADGSFMVGGYEYTNPGRQTASYLHVLADGTLDPAYGGAFRTLGLKGGDARHSTSFDEMRALPDGSVIAAGEFGGDVLLFKITPSGFGTRKFGTGGLTSIDFGADEDVASGLVSLADGSLVVLAASDRNPVLARFSADGQLMTAFGDNGKASPSLAPSTPEATIKLGDLALAADGRLLVVGSIGNEYVGTGQGFVAALNQRGHSIRTYGNHGVATFDFGSDMERSDGSLAATAKDGSLIVGGEAVSTPGTRFGLAKVRADGSLDATFGASGRVTTQISAPASVLNTRLALQSDGRIIAMTNYRLAESGVVFARFNADGSVDPTFGNGGTIKLPIDGGSLLNTDLAIDPEGRIVGLFAADASSNPGLRIVRLTPRGQLDPTFGINGILDPAFTDGSGTAALGLQGSQVLVAVVGGSDTLRIRRFSDGGKLDTAFGNRGEESADVEGEFETSIRLAVAPDGAFFIARQIRAVDFGEDGPILTIWIDLLKFSRGGAVDGSFGSSGSARAVMGENLGYIGSSSTPSIGLLPDGRIAVGAHANEISVAIFRSDGKPDQLFGNNGVVHTEFGTNRFSFPTAVLPAADGGVLVGGSYELLNPGALALLRLTRTGKLDQTYGGMGSGVALSVDDSHSSTGSALLQSDGGVLLAGSGDLEFVRFLADDSPAITAHIDAHVLKIQGTQKADHIILRRQPDGIEVLSIPGRFPLSAFSRIEITGSGGDDFIDASSSSIPVYIDGGDGDDSILGGAAADSLLGGNGRDTLFGGRGDDTLAGGNGNDYLSGGPGADHLFGDAGNDQFYAFDSEIDALDGGAGFDRIKADPDDLLTQVEARLF